MPLIEGDHNSHKNEEDISWRLKMEQKINKL